MNLSKSFSFVFEDDKWVETILVGGLLLIIPILGQFYMLGFFVEAARRAMNNAADLLPEWNEVGKKIGDGFKMFLITFIYALPLIVVAVVVGLLILVPTSAGFGNDNLGIAELAIICFSVCFIPLMIALSILLQVASFSAWGIFVKTDDLGAALNFGSAFAHMKGRIGSYLIVWLVSILAGIIGGLGSVVFGFGALFTTIYGQAMFGNYFGQFVAEEGAGRD